jgi:flagellar hook-basal body complex protein FliE
VIVPPVGGLGGGLSIGQAEGLANAGQSSGGVGASGEAGGFGGELTEAISSLEKTQDSASSASQALATGTVSDPESAVVTVEDAQLAMELAGQIRTKATEAAQSIFNTQV